MIHLIGVEHKVQWRKPKVPAYEKIQPEIRRTNWELYSEIIRRAVCVIQPSVVAEEMNQEILDRNNNAESILLNFADDYKTHTGKEIQHLFAEPNLAEKDAVGYKDEEAIKAILTTRMHAEPTCEQIMAHIIAHHHPKRERIWFEKIEEHRDSEMLFVCGDIHLYTFRRFLRAKGIHCRIAKRKIGVDSSCLSEYKGLKLAIQNNMCSDVHCFCLDPISGAQVS